MEKALADEVTSFTPNLALLKILIVGKSQSIVHYQLSLEEFTKQYPKMNLPVMPKIIDASRSFELKQEKSNLQFSQSFDAPHYFVLVYKTESKIEDVVSKTLEGFNQNQFKSQGLKVSNLILDESQSLTFVSDLSNMNEAQEYYRVFTEKQPTLTALKNHKFNTFVITKSNFDILYRTKSLDEYLQFFEKLSPEKSITSLD